MRVQQGIRMGRWLYICAAWVRNVPKEYAARPRAGACAAGSGRGAVHDVGRAHQVQHGGVVEVVAKGHDLGGGDAQRFAKQRHAGALVGQGGVDPVRPGHGGIGLLPAGDEAVNVLFHALVQIDADLDDVLGDLGGVVDEFVLVADEFYAVRHS